MTIPGEPAGRPDDSRSRERELARTFAMLAGSLVEDCDIVDLLERLTEACVRLLGVTAAGLLEIFQLQNDQGPSLDCVRTGTAVVSGDLDADRSRWPLFASFAVAAGFRSAAALPMRLREKTVGGLNLFYDHAVPVTPEAQRLAQALAQALADAAAACILQQPSAERGPRATGCPWRWRPIHCGDTPAIRISSSRTSPPLPSTTISAPRSAAGRLPSPGPFTVERKRR